MHPIAGSRTSSCLSAVGQTMRLAYTLIGLMLLAVACGGSVDPAPTPTPPTQIILIPTADPVQLARTGQRVAEQKTCLGCHTTDGGTAVGPTWQGLIGSTREFLDGTSAVADVEYIRQSIKDPKAKIVKDFLDLMPADLEVSDRDIDAIIAYIETLE